MAFVPAEFMFVDHEENRSSSTSPYVLSSSCAPQDYFNGVSVPLLMRRSMSFSGVERCEEEEEEVHGDDVSDDGSQLGEKKIKRLNMEQVKALEKSFELGNKLEPERKMHLARALGLEPRQVAIWFQNRRARWKTKQLEKDYGLLKRNYELLKAQNDALQVHNKKLHTQLMVLKGRESSDDQSGPINLNKETKGFWNNVASDVNLGGATKTTPETETDSPLYSHPDNKHMFPSPAAKSTSIITQVFPQTSTTTSDHQSQKIDQMVPADENFCNMFTTGGGGIDNQPGFWPWPEQQHFH